MVRPVEPPEKTADIQQALSMLSDMTYVTLKEKWRGVYASPPPRGLSRRLLIYGIAYQIQVKAFGGLKPLVKQALRDTAGQKARKEKASRILPPGTRLMREWRGTVHVVDVTADGLIWNGRCFRSLSAIANHITGTQWNGYRFFGLKVGPSNSKEGLVA